MWLDRLATKGHYRDMAGTAGCTGIEVIATEDGPLKLACLCDQCTADQSDPERAARRSVRDRIARAGDVFLGAANNDDEEFF